MRKLIIIERYGGNMLMKECEDKIVWDLEVCKDITLLKEAERIIIYGAAEKGKDILGWLHDAGIEIDYFCDMDLKKWGGYIEDKEIISPYKMKDDIDRYGKISYVIACIQYPGELFELLKKAEMQRVRLISYWGIRAALQIHAESIYKENLERRTLLQIENKLRKRKYIDLGMEYVRALIKSPDNALWVIQPEKAASSSLDVRLKKNNIPFYIGHYLEYPSHILGEEYRYIWEREIQKKRTIKLIVAVREPLSRDYSAFWQSFTEHVQQIMRMPILQNDFQKMFEEFVDFILKGSWYTKERLGDSMPYTWNDEFEWFDEQIKRHLGIDIFQYPFNKDKGYTIIKEKNVEIFLFKVEKMEDLIDDISLFTGTERLPVLNTNIAEQKWYNLAYIQFRKEVRLPKKYVDHYYQGNPKMDYFYTQEEKNRFLSQWQTNIEAGDQAVD